MAFPSAATELGLKAYELDWRIWEAPRGGALPYTGGLGGPFPPDTPRGTIVAMSTEPLRTVRDRFSEFIDRVQGQHERVVVTKNGTPAAVLISTEDLESLEETLAVLGDSDAVAELLGAHRAYLEGDVVRGEEAVRALRPR